MHVDHSGLLLSPTELDDLVQRLNRLAVATRSTDAKALAVRFQVVAASIAAHLSLAAQTVTVSQYARAHGLNVRTVRWRCQTKRLPATKRAGQWAIFQGIGLTKTEYSTEPAPLMTRATAGTHAPLAT